MLKRKGWLLILVTVILLGLVACTNTDNEELDEPENALEEPTTSNDGDEELPYTPDNNMDNYSIIINGAGSMISFFTMEGANHPTHLPTQVMDEMGVVVIGAGSQGALEINGEFVGHFDIINYQMGLEGIVIGENDAFQTDDFTTYLPISLLRQVGFEITVTSSQVSISLNN